MFHIKICSRVHTASSLLSLPAVSCRSEAELEKIVLLHSVQFWFVPEHLDVLKLLDWYVLAHFVRTRLNHCIPNLFRAAPARFVELQILGEIQCMPTPFLKDVAPFVFHKKTPKNILLLFLQQQNIINETRMEMAESQRLVSLLMSLCIGHRPKCC